MTKKNIETFVGRITNGDSATILSSIKSNSVDLVVTSPPYDDLRDYNNESTWNFDIFKKIARQLYRVVKDGGVVVWVVGDSVVKGNK